MKMAMTHNEMMEAKILHIKSETLDATPHGYVVHFVVN